MVLSFTQKLVPTIPVPMGDGVPAVTSSTPPDCPPLRLLRCHRPAS